MPRPRAWNPKRLGCITTHFIILEQLKRLVARLDRWSLIVTVCFSNDQSTEFRAIGTEPRRFSQKGFDSWEPMFKKRARVDRNRPKGDEILPSGSFPADKPRFFCWTPKHQISQYRVLQIITSAAPNLMNTHRAFPVCGLWTRNAAFQSLAAQ